MRPLRAGKDRQEDCEKCPAGTGPLRIPAYGSLLAYLPRAPDGCSPEQADTEQADCKYGNQIRMGHPRGLCCLH